MRKRIFQSVLTIGLISILNHGSAQITTEEKKDFSYFVDYVMGPFLFVDNIAYDAVFMNGCRLGFNLKHNFNFSIEYVAGQQPDNTNNMGMTHNANFQFAYHFLPNSQPFNPYLFVGSGFFEFKEFNVDVYGISKHVGLGTKLNFNDRLSGLIESRYLNTGWLDVGGQNQLAVMWGVRVGF